MHNKTEAPNLKKICLRACIAITCAVILLALTPQMRTVSAESNAQILISPTMTRAHIGENITVTVNVSDVAQLYVWQVYLKYNETIAKCTAAWIPADNVFAGQLSIPVAPVNDTDATDGLHFLLYGNSLIGGAAVNVSNGILFKANFTAAAHGATTISIVTPDKPVDRGGGMTDNSLLMTPHDSDLIQVPYTCPNPGSTVIIGVVNVQPTASFVVISPSVNNTSNYIVSGNPGAVKNYAIAYKGLPSIFNASGSYAPLSYITSYEWDFGDGTKENTTNPVVSHVYYAVGPYTVQLIVSNNGTPHAFSTPASKLVMVDLVLQLYDWSPVVYGVIALIIIGIIVYAFVEIRNALRRHAPRRREELRRKVPTTGPSTTPSTEA